MIALTNSIGWSNQFWVSLCVFSSCCAFLFHAFPLGYSAWNPSGTWIQRAEQPWISTRAMQHPMWGEPCKEIEIEELMAKAFCHVKAWDCCVSILGLRFKTVKSENVERKWRPWNFQMFGPSFYHSPRLKGRRGSKISFLAILLVTFLGWLSDLLPG